MMRIAFNSTINRFSASSYKSRSISFRGFECSEDNFEIKNLHNIPCPICSTPMVLRSQINDFSQEVEGKCGEKIIKTLLKNNLYYHKLQKEAVEIILEKAQQYPYSELDELTKKAYSEVYNSVFSKQSAKFEDIINMLKRFDSVSEDKVNMFSEKYNPKRNIENPFDASLFLDDLNSILGSASPSSRKKVMRIAKKMYNSEIELVQFLKKMKDKTPKEIALELLEPSLATTEHLKTRQEGGENNSANYVAQCKYCNEYRGHKKFKQWISNFPDFTKTANLYMESVAKSIQKGELSKKYDDYLVDVCKTIFDESQGMIKLEAPEAINGNTILEDYKVLARLIVRITKRKKDLKEEIQKAKALREIMGDDIQFQNIKKYLENNEDKNLKVQILSAQRPYDDSKNSELLSNVDFPSELEARVLELNNELCEITSIEEKIYSIKTRIEEKDSLVADMRKNENEISELILDNQKIDTSNSTNEGLNRYRELSVYLKRLDYIEQTYFKNCSKKTKNEDKAIFDYSREKLLYETQDLALNNATVRYNINLDKIESATKNLRELNKRIEQITIAEKELAALEEQLELKNSKEEIKAEIEILADKIKMANMRFSSLGIEKQINDLEKELKETDVLSERLKVKSVSITRKEYIDLCEEYGIEPFGGY